MIRTLVLVISLVGSAVHAAEGECGRTCVRKVRIAGSCPTPTRVNFDDVDHGLFDALLCEYVDCQGNVCYKKWSRDCNAVWQLHEYLVSLGCVDVYSATASRNGEISYFINAYNALAIWGILREYPSASIQAHNRKRAEYRIFDDLQLSIGGEYVSLNEIEGMLRELEEPRIHFALVCAAQGCPRLRNEAYLPSRLEEQLTDNTREFFTRRSRFRICRATRTVKVSPILKWYREDFGDCDENILAYITPFLPCKDQQWLACQPCPKLKFLGYNWGLNDQCPTIGVVVGRIPYALYAKFEPHVRRFLPSSQADCTNCESVEADDSFEKSAPSAPAPSAPALPKPALPKPAVPKPQ